MLLNCLLNTRSGLVKTAQPILVPVLGRGRAFPPMVGDDITAANIARCCKFLVSACSCEVKYSSPGLDLLIVSDWGGKRQAIGYEEWTMP